MNGFVTFFFIERKETTTQKTPTLFQMFQSKWNERERKKRVFIIRVLGVSNFISRMFSLTFHSDSISFWLIKNVL